MYKSFLGVEDMKLVIGVVISLDIALIALIPVCVGYVKTNIEKSNYKYKKQTKGRLLDFLKNSCDGIILWCVISLILASVWYFAKDECLFLFLSSLKLAIVIIWLVWYYAVMSHNWPKTYSDNILKEHNS